MNALLQQLISDTLNYAKGLPDPQQSWLVEKEALLLNKEVNTPLYTVSLGTETSSKRPIFSGASSFAITPKGTLGPTPEESPFERFPPPPVQRSAAPSTPVFIKRELPKEPPKKETAKSPSIVKEALAKLAPQLRFVDQIPDDAEGKKIANSWKEKVSEAEVILLACRQDEKTIEFLKALAKAIDGRLAKTKIIPAERIEREQHWDLFLQKNTFRLIVASEGMEQLKGLMHFYRKEPTQNRCFLDKTPLLSLLPSEIYKQLEKKAQLWKTLCHMLKA